MIDFDVLRRADLQELWRKATCKANMCHLDVACFYIKDVETNEGSSILFLLLSLKELFRKQLQTEIENSVFKTKSSSSSSWFIHHPTYWIHFEKTVALCVETTWIHYANELALLIGTQADVRKCEFD